MPKIDPVLAKLICGDLREMLEDAQRRGEATIMHPDFGKDLSREFYQRVETALKASRSGC